MKRLIISIIILLLMVVAMSSCYPSRKAQSDLRGLMLLDNLQLKKNRAFYSKHNSKTRKEAFRKYRKSNRNL
jgi:hypothetical protein